MSKEAFQLEWPDTIQTHSLICLTQTIFSIIFRVKMSQILYGTYTKKVFLVHLKFKFNWTSYFFLFVKSGSLDSSPSSICSSMPLIYYCNRLSPRQHLTCTASSQNDHLWPCSPCFIKVNYSLLCANTNL